MSEDVSEMQNQVIGPKAVAAILEQLLPCVDPEKMIAAFGDRKVIYSDDSDSPSLYVEILLLEKRKECIHLCASVFSSQSNETGATDVIINRRCG